MKLKKFEVAEISSLINLKLKKFEVEEKWKKFEVEEMGYFGGQGRVQKLF